MQVETLMGYRSTYFCRQKIRRPGGTAHISSEILPLKQASPVYLNFKTIYLIFTEQLRFLYCKYANVSNLLEIHLL